MIAVAERALGYVQGLTFEQFSADPKTIDAVSFSIDLGEAATALKDVGPKLAPEIPWPDIRGMRNQVAHEYFGVDAKVLWQTVGRTYSAARDPSSPWRAFRSGLSQFPPSLPRIVPRARKSPRGLSPPAGSSSGGRSSSAGRRGAGGGTPHSAPT